MELHGDRLIPAPLATTWAALNDPEVLKSCIAGCESLERTGDDAYVAVVAMKIGPVSARFKGNLKMTNVDAPNGYTINFDGQGGVAGFGKGSADVKLAAEGDATTRLVYDARAQVGGKMAQIGSRLIDATAGKITEDFFKAFGARLQALVPAPAGGCSPAGDDGRGGVAGSGSGSGSGSDATACARWSAAEHDGLDPHGGHRRRHPRPHASLGTAVQRVARRRTHST